MDDRGGDSTLPPLFSRGWWLFFNAVTVMLGRLVDAVTGSVNLTHTGRLTKVGAAGSLVESAITETLQRTQAQLAALAATLTSSDNGQLVEVTDYRHLLRWTAPAWGWAATDDGQHPILGLAVDPNPATGWALCDGSATTYLKGDGTTGAYTTPNLTGSPAYLKLGAAVTGINAAVAPVFAGTPVAVTGTVGAIGGTGSAPVNGGSAGLTAAAQGHTHSAPSFSGNALTPTGTVGTTGEPQNIVLRPWFRR